jgi:nucleoid DNA-binding protein
MQQTESLSYSQPPLDIKVKKEIYAYIDDMYETYEIEEASEMLRRFLHSVTKEITQQIISHLMKLPNGEEAIDKLFGITAKENKEKGELEEVFDYVFEDIKNLLEKGYV